MYKIPGKKTSPADDTVAAEQQDDQDSVFTGESAQVAGKFNAAGDFLSGLVRRAKGGADHPPAPDLPPASSVPPAAPTPPPAAPRAKPKPKPKTKDEIEQGVIERSKLPSEDEAMRAAQNIRNADALPPVEPGRTALRNFRSDKLQTAEDIKRLIDDVAAENQGFMEARRGVVSHEQTRAEAAQIDVRDLLARKPAEAWNAAQLSAGRDILLELGERIHTQAAHVLTEGATVADKLEFRQLMAQHAAVQKTLQGAVAEAGRALNIMKSVSAASGKLRTQQIMDSLETVGGSDVTTALARMVVDAGTDPVRLAAIQRRGFGTRAMGAIHEIWINGLLSGPQTHIVNTTSNTLFAMMQVPERALAGAGRSVAKNVFGAGDGVELGEAGAQLYGKLAGFKDGIRAFARTLKHGDSADPITKIELQRMRAITADNFNLKTDSTLGRAVDLFGEYYVRLPGRFLVAEDDFFKAVNYRMELNAQAYRQAAREGLTGDARIQRMAELVNDPSEELHLAAQSYARYGTFTKELTGDNFIEAIGQAGYKISNLPLGKFVVPFVRTPTNIAQAVLERSPMAPMMASWRADVAAGGAARDLALARMAMGSGFSGLVAVLAYHDKITGDGPADKKVRANMMAAGWQPNSVYIDGKYYSINRLDPVGAMIANAANAVDILRYAEEGADTEHVAAAIVMGFANAMTNKTYMRGLSEALEVIGDPNNEKKLSTYMARQEASFVPSWLNFAKGMTDPVVREPVRTDHLSMTIDMMKSRIPGLSEEVPPRVDLWGETVQIESSPLSPFRAVEVKENPEAVELARNRLGIDPPKALVHVPIGFGKSSPVNLYAVDPTGHLLADYKRRTGWLARRNVSALMQDPGYLGLPEGPDGERAEYIRNAFVNARQQALAEIMDEQRQRKVDEPGYTSLEDHGIAAFEAGKRAAMPVPQPLVEAAQPVAEDLAP